MAGRWVPLIVVGVAVAGGIGGYAGFALGGRSHSQHSAPSAVPVTADDDLFRPSDYVVPEMKRPAASEFKPTADGAMTYSGTSPLSDSDRAAMDRMMQKRMPCGHHFGAAASGALGTIYKCTQGHRFVASQNTLVPDRH